MNNIKKKHSFPFFGSCALLINDESELLQPELILKLPYMYSITLAGTFLLEKEGIIEIVENANRRALKTVLVTDGSMPDRLLSLASAFPKMAIRIILRGIGDPGSQAWQKYKDTMILFDRLRDAGSKDIGISMFVNDGNAEDAVRLCETCACNGLKLDIINTGGGHAGKKTLDALLFIKHKMLRYEGLKGLFEAMHIQNAIDGKEDICDRKNFFIIDQFGYICRCIAAGKLMQVGNLNDQEFEKIWSSKRAQLIDIECRKSTKERV